MSRKIKMLGAVLTLLPAFLCAQDVAGTLKSLRGQTMIERDGVKRPGKVGEALYPKDRVLTSADGYVSVGLRDQSSLAIGPNSDVDLTKYNFNSTTHQGEQQVRVRSGSLAAISGKLAKASPEAVQFNAGTVTLGVRGTQFVVELQASPDQSSVVLLKDSQQQFVRSGSGLCWQIGASSSGCPTPTDRFVLLPDRNGEVGAITLHREGKTLDIRQAFAGAEIGEGDFRTVSFSESDLRARYKNLLGTLPPSPRTFIVRFATGSADQLAPGSQIVIQQIKDAMTSWPVIPNVDVVGHTDTSGKAEQNDALSLQRAQVVSRWLDSTNLTSDRLQISGRGERQLLVPTPDETSEPMNRRVEITVY